MDYSTKLGTFTRERTEKKKEAEGEPIIPNQTRKEGWIIQHKLYTCGGSVKQGRRGKKGGGNAVKGRYSIST